MTVQNATFSQFADGGYLLNNDIVVGLRGGVNTKFIYNASGGGGGDVNSITGTQDQVLVNGTYGTQEVGNITLTLPQSIATSSSPNFLGLTLTNPLSVLSGGTGFTSTTPYAVLCGGANSGDPLQPVASVGLTGQALISNGPGALPTFQNISGAGTVNAGLANQIAWYASNGTTVSGLPTANDGVLLTDSTGFPSISPSEALTKSDDTNVTITLGGTPANSLLKSVSLTMGWAGELSVPRGGTGLSSVTAYSVLCGGITSTDPLQPVASVGTSGQVLTSNGPGALPTFEDSGGGFSQINIQRVTTTGSGTYTPTPGMAYVIVQAQAGGGGGGGADNGGITNDLAGSGGGGGEYIEALFTAAQIGASKPYEVGIGGAGGSNTGGNGVAGGNTTFNTTWIVANGGPGGNGAPPSGHSVTALPVNGGSGGSVATGILIKNSPGGASNVAFYLTGNDSLGSNGGNAGCGAGGVGLGAVTLINQSSPGGNALVSSGSGGGGAAYSISAGAGSVGGDGGSGYITFIEYIV